MTTLLDEYVDALAEFLDEKIPLEDAYNQITDTIFEDDITIADVVLHFAKVYEATTEEYVENLSDDEQWAIEHDLVGVHFDDELEDTMMPKEFDS